MKKFAFIGYPLSWDLLLKQNPKFRNLTDYQAKSMLIDTPPFIASEITGVKSNSGEEILGYFVLVYLLPEQILELDSSLVIRKIVQASKLSEEKGAKIIGLGGLTSVIGNQGQMVAKDIDIAVTTGNSYTAAMTAQATLKAAKMMDIELKHATVSIIGATGSIGSICSHMFAEQAKKVNIVARNIRRLSELAKSLKSLYKADINTSTEINRVISESDIIVTATSSPTVLIDVKDLKPGSVVCDVATPRNVAYSSKEMRKDVLVIDGGLIKPPGEMKINFDIGLPSGIAYACLSETMILTFENRFENFTLGSGLSLEKVKEITKLGEKHGFKLSDFKSFGQTITDKDIYKIKELKAKAK